MSKKLLIGTTTILLSGIFLALATICYHFYYLFPNSHQLFQLRHNYFQHLEFHTDKWNYIPGQDLQVYASATSPEKTRIRGFSITGNDTLFEQDISLSFQQAHSRVSVEGTKWQKSFSMPIPENTPTGWYVIQLENRDFCKSSSIFINPPASKVQKKVALLLSTNTWNAYNYWGGQSLYSKNYSHTVSFQRPQLLADPFIQNTYPNQQLYYQAANIDKPLAELLQKNKIPFDVYAVEEIHRSSERLQEYEVLIMSTHPEYWTKEMFINLNTCLDSGASLLNLGGNTAAWETFLDVKQRTIRVHKGGEENYWRVVDTLELRPFGLEETAFGFHSFGPYEVLADTSFLWEGLDIQAGDFFGEYSETYDYAYAYSGKWKLLLSLFRKGTLGAASGLELDRVHKNITPQNWITVAKGWNQDTTGAGKVLRIADVKAREEEPLGADMGYYVHAGGGIVFQTGSLAFCGAIPYDETIQKIILNAIRKR